MARGLGSKIQLLCREKGWTQVELARRAGIATNAGQAWLSRLMTGRHERVDPKRLGAVASALGLTVEELAADRVAKEIREGGTAYKLSELQHLVGEVERRCPERVEWLKGVMHALLATAPNDPNDLKSAGAAIPY